MAPGPQHRDPGTLFEDEKLDMAIPDFYCAMPSSPPTSLL
jgi:hypothetical protein